MQLYFILILRPVKYTAFTFEVSKIMNAKQYTEFSLRPDEYLRHTKYMKW
jgi:hypothetical protein